jgi:hypothetical protein
MKIDDYVTQQRQEMKRTEAVSKAAKEKGLELLVEESNGSITYVTTGLCNATDVKITKPIEAYDQYAILFSTQLKTEHGPETVIVRKEGYRAHDKHNYAIIADESMLDVDKNRAWLRSLKEHYHALGASGKVLDALYKDGTAIIDEMAKAYATPSVENFARAV